ncbi:MAG: T9SS C-terminal target domain-containing protein [Calditrichaeota bacterium]|nr:MAG: T9SS C-terminal target domain-containing protein [Calditrichota bacterium]
MLNPYDPHDRESRMVKMPLPPAPSRYRPDSVPLPRALVRVFLAGTDFHRRTHTNENGEFKISGLPSGQYYVQAIAEGFVSEFFDNVHNRSNATLVDVVAPDETPNIDFALSPRERKRGTIAGLVVSDADDGPIDGAVIIAVSPQNLRPHITFSGENGRYELTDLPPGTYFVFAWAEGFIGEFYKDAKRFQNADEVIVLPDNITPGIDFSLQPEDTPGLYVVRGTIRSAATGAPVEGALVHARVGDHIQLTAVSDANGNYMISGLPAGEYKIEATGVGYATGFFGGSDETSAASVAVGGGQDAASIDLTLEEDNVTSVGSQNGTSGVPESFALFQNYPNPFNPETTIKYQLPEAAHLTVKIYNILGQEIRTLVDKQQPAGVYSVTWDGKDSLGRQVASGIYIYQVKAGEKFRSSRRMLMLK